MLLNYLKVALRGLARNKLYTLINIVGLAIGLAGCLLIVGFVSNELSFENTHEKADRIYRVAGYHEVSDSKLVTARAVPALAPALREGRPEIETAVRFRVWDDTRFEIDGQALSGAKSLVAEPELLEIFTLPLLAGNASTALKDPYTLLVTEDAGKLYFGDEDPIGKTIRMQGADLQVTGVLQNLPANTQLGCDFVIAYATLADFTADENPWTTLGEDYVYALLHEGADPGSVTAALPGIFAEHLDVEEAAKFHFHLQPLKDIYLHSNLSWELQPTGDLSSIYLFSCIAVLILVIACINFVNISTARTAHRAREVGLRKVLGAQRADVVKRFLGESLLIAVAAMALGLAFFEVGKPYLDAYLERQLAIALWNSPTLLLTVVGMVLLVGLMAGAYPALYLSRYRPASILRGAYRSGASRSFARRALVVVQFAIVIGLVSFAVAVHEQTHFFRTVDKGFEADNVVALFLDGGDERTPVNAARLADEIRSASAIQSATAAGSLPGENYLALTYVEDVQNEESSPHMVQLLGVDYDYIDNFGLTLLEGRNFSAERPADRENGIIVSESMAELLGWEGSVVGRTLKRSTRELTVLGKVKDFYSRPLYSGIIPFFLEVNPDDYRAVAVKLREGDIGAQLEVVRLAWERVLPNTPFEHQFLHDVIGAQYVDEEKLGHLFTFFAGLAIAIACLGVFALASFTAERRTKEIGIRKVLGASTKSVVGLLSREFMILVLVSNLIAWPVAYYFIDEWLSDFASRFELGVGVFLAAAAIALVIALLTVSFQAIKAATANPIESLKYE